MAGALVALRWPSPCEWWRLLRSKPSISEAQMVCLLWGDIRIAWNLFFFSFFLLQSFISSEMTFSLFISTAFYLVCKL